MPQKIAIAIPCYDECTTIGKVVSDFRDVFPTADIYVFDNNSQDNSDEVARHAGAHVIDVRKQGKGHVAQAIFRELYDYEAIIMVDGDDTYYAEDARRLLEPVLQAEADMVVGNRLPSVDDTSMVRLHRFGNRLIVRAVNQLFRTDFLDILSGYRVFGNQFIENVPLLTSGFEIETEMTIQALEENITIKEFPVSYRSRPEGSISKLRSFQDGYRIMLAAVILLRDHRPLWLFGILAAICWCIGLIAAILRFSNFVSFTAFSNSLLSGLILLFIPVGAIFLSVGLILNTINTRFKEVKQLNLRKKRSHHE